MSSFLKFYKDDEFSNDSLEIGIDGKDSICFDVYSSCMDSHSYFSIHVESIDEVITFLQQKKEEIENMA